MSMRNGGSYARFYKDFAQPSIYGKTLNKHLHKRIEIFNFFFILLIFIHGFFVQVYFHRSIFERFDSE